MNLLDMQVIQEGPRSATVHISGVLDTENVSLTPAVQLTDFTNNDASLGALTSLRAAGVEYVIGDGIQVRLAWNSLNPQTMYALAGRGKIKGPPHFSSLMPDTTRTGYSGDVNLSTTGFVAGTTQNFTLRLHLLKVYG